VGGIGVFCNPGVNGFNVGDPGTFAFVGGATTTDQTNLAQGRVLVDGQLINAGASVPIVGQTGGYTADIANAQEVNIKVSGALGESETGGSEINIVPKTGGNRFAGDYNSTFTTERWFATNNQNYSNVPAAFQPVKNDHDVSLAFGGRSSAIGSGSSRSGASRGSTSCRWASTSGPTRGKASVRRALRAGPVDRAAHHSRLRAPLRSRDERVR